MCILNEDRFMYEYTAYFKTDNWSDCTTCLPKTIAHEWRLEAALLANQLSHGKPFARPATDATFVKINTVASTTERVYLTIVDPDKMVSENVTTHAGLPTSPSGLTDWIGDVVMMSFQSCSENTTAAAGKKSLVVKIKLTIFQCVYES